MAIINKMVIPVTDGQGTITNEEIEFESSGGSANYYGTCTGQAANQIKAVTISSDQGFELKTGVLIFVKFDANNSYNATTSNPIKLNVNNTGAKQIYAGNTATPEGTNTTYFGRTNYINQYIYNGTYWVWNGSSADNDVDTTYQLKYGNSIFAAGNILYNSIVVGTSSGYKTAASGITFDISYPILLSHQSVTSGSTIGWAYKVINSIAATSLKSGLTGTARSTCYLVLSSINGEIATVDSTVFTSSPNTSGKYYIPVGLFVESTNLLIDTTDQSIFEYDGTTLKPYSPGGGGSGLPDEVITYEQFRAKSDSEQLAYTGYVSGWPGGGGGDEGFEPIVLSGTLEAGDTEITFTDSNILANSMIDIFIDSDEDIYPTSKTSSVGEVVLEFDSQENDLNVALLIFNLMS